MNKNLIILTDGDPKAKPISEWPAEYYDLKDMVVRRTSDGAILRKIEHFPQIKEILQD